MIKFGTGGWRGLIGKDFIYDNICRAAQGIADMIKEDGRQATPVMLGFDRRFLSFDAAQWIAQTLCANGITVWVYEAHGAYAAHHAHGDGAGAFLWGAGDGQP